MTTTPQKTMIRCAHHAKSVIGFGSPMGRCKSRQLKNKTAFFASARTSFGGPDGKAARLASVPLVFQSRYGLPPLWKGVSGLKPNWDTHMTHITPMGLAPTLVVIDGKPTTTSNDIAVHFNKRHADVIRAIENIGAPQNFNERNFALVEFVDAKGERRPAYRITRDGFTLLAMGFTGKRALTFKLAYIEAFNKMEAALRAATVQKPHTAAPPAAPTLLDRQAAEIAELLSPLTTARRKEWTSFTRGFVMGCETNRATEMAYLS
jgi:Rha family phage regulatory protein